MDHYRESIAGRKLAILLALFTVLSFCVPFFQPEPVLAERPAVAVTTSHVLLYCDNTGDIVFSTDEEATFLPQAATRLMTALIAVQKLPMEQIVTISKAASERSENSEIKLKKGEKIKAVDLLHIALKTNSPDAVYALAEAVSGDWEDFIKLMNKSASNMGLRDSHFSSAVGQTGSDDNYTTLSDFLIITKVAFSDQTIRSAAGLEEHTIKATNKAKERTITADASLIPPDHGVFCAVPGSYEGNYSLIFASERDGLTLYGILFGNNSEALKEDARRVIEYGNNTIEGSAVVTEGDDMGMVHIRHGARIRAACSAGATGYAYLPKEASQSLISTRINLRDDVTAPVAEGDQVGVCEIYVGDSKVNEIPIIVNESVPEGWFPSYIGISNRATIIILAVLTLLFLILLIILILRIHYRRKFIKARKEAIRKKAHQQYAEEMDRYLELMQGEDPEQDQ